MADDFKIVELFIEYARDNAVAPQTLTGLLAELRDALFAGNIQDGKVLTSTTEAGGTAAFALIPGYTPVDLASIAQKAIKLCRTFPDPDNPPADLRQIRRLRVSFSKATID